MKRLFTSDRFFAVSVVLSVLGMLLYTVRMFCRVAQTGETVFLNFALNCLAIALCVLGVYVTYKKHLKNVMKPLVGALLMALVLDSFTYLSCDRAFDRAFAAAYIVLSAALFVNHMIINGSRHPSRRAVSGNIALCVLIALYQVVYLCVTLPGMRGNPFAVIGFVAYVVGYVFMLAAVVCIETRLDAYRLDREKAGWTPENGYPENYVHEYEKK